MNAKAGPALSALASLALVLSLASMTVWFIGESPTQVFKVLIESSLGSADNFSYTLHYATPLLLTGTSVALALEAGLFNIGAEGQLYMGALAAACWGIATKNWLAGASPPLFPTVLVTVAGALISFAAGGAWGAIAGYLRLYRQIHEVIATIMMNFIALAFVNWAILNPLKNPDTQNLETVWVGEALRFGRLWKQMPWGFPFALLLSAALFWGLKRTWWGFRVRATGKNEIAARVAGIDIGRTSCLAMGLSGGIAGLVGFQEVFLNSHRLLDGFSPGYGFTGLAIALLARGNVAGLLASALLFGALYKGSLDLDLETEKVTRDLSAVIQALILVTLAARPWLADKMGQLWPKKGERP